MADDPSNLNSSLEAAEAQNLVVDLGKVSLSNEEPISNGLSHDALPHLHKDALSSAENSIAGKELRKNCAEELISKASVHDISSTASNDVHGSRLDNGGEPADCEVAEKAREYGVERWPQEIEEVVDLDKKAGNGTSHDSTEEVGAAQSERNTPFQVFPVPNIGSRDSLESAEEPRDTNSQDMGVPERNLILGKQHQDEDDTSISWRKHKKHFFILSNAGKPIYSRYGDEHKLAGFSATLQAIISFVKNSGDCIRYLRAGDHQVVFLVKGPLYLVAISATDEPIQILRGQLELLHGQLILILTKSLEKCFLKNANFDMRPLLGGTEIVFSSLIRSFSWSFTSFLHSYTCLPLAHKVRLAAGAALQDIADSDVLFGLLLADSKVISLVEAPKTSFHPDDIFLLSNFVSSLESFRTTESFSPICLPKYNSMAFLYAYVHYLDTSTCLILITSNPDAFFYLKECRVKIENFLLETRVLSDISISVMKGGLRVEDLPGDAAYGSVVRSGLFFKRKMDTNKTEYSGDSKERMDVGGAAGLVHFIYRSVYLDQYVASEFSPPLHTKRSQKRLFRAYERLYASMHCGSAGSYQMQYRRDEHHVLLGWSTADFEFFAAFDPLAEKSSAITVCNRACQWIRDAESDVFYTGTSPFNW